ncbi:MAG: hypothetical protein CL908_15720 [Deltaproteobacteria bacterium]|nr:hypothetical protein [Deltaproteobacteria bacterium]
MGRYTQISAYITPQTREALEQYAEAHGVKKGHLIETALLHHLQALRELPQDVIIPPRIVVSAETGEWLFDLIEEPPEPNAAMQALFAEGEKTSA